ncbi:MAG: hypothetical protein ACRBCS_05090 [Cellvibrionaceae bacterium]
MNKLKLTTTATALWALCSFSLHSLGADSTLDINAKKKPKKFTLEQTKANQSHKTSIGQPINTSKVQKSSPQGVGNGTPKLTPIAPAIRTPAKNQQSTPSQGIKPSPSTTIRAIGNNPKPNNSGKTIPSAPTSSIKQPPARIQTPPQFQRGAPSQGIKTSPAAPARVAPSRNTPTGSRKAPQSPRAIGQGSIQSPNTSGFSPATPSQNGHQGSNTTGRPAISSGMGGLPSTSAPQQNGGPASGGPVNGGTAGPGFAQPSTARDGSSTYTLSNGQQVPATGRDGSPATVGRDGSVSYNDGTSVSTNSAGETVITSPDGSQRTNPPPQTGESGFAQPSTASDGTATYTLDNGEQVPATGQDGSPARVHRDGSVSYNDGTSVSTNDNGETVVTSPDGTQSTSTPHAAGPGFATPATTLGGESVYVLSNGDNVAATDGLLVNRDGSLTGPDGTHVYVDPLTNETVVQNPDGSERSRDAPPSERGGSQSSNSQTSSSDDDDNDDDTDDDNGDNDDSDDNSDDSNDDGDSGNESEDDTGDEGSSDEANSGFGLSESGLQHESKTTADDFVAKKKGENREPESTAPPTCGEDSSGPPRGVSEPQPGESGNCVPAGLTPSAEKEEEGEEDDTGFTVPSIEELRESNTGGVNIDPTGMEDDMRGSGPSFEEQLEDIGDTINPGS